MTKNNVPPQLWDFRLKWTCEKGNLCVSSSKYARGCTPIEHISGETPDISEYLDFSFYDWVVFKQNAGLGEALLGRWLGVSHLIGQLMSYWVLPISCVPISCVTVQKLTNLEQNTREWQSKMDSFDQTVQKRLELKNPPVLYFDQINNSDNKLSLTNDKEFIEEYSKVIKIYNVKEEEMDDNLPENYVNMELSMPRGEDDQLQFGTVKRRALDQYGKPIGKGHNNPILDSHLYEVKYLDSSIETLSANTTAVMTMVTVSYCYKKLQVTNKISKQLIDQHLSTKMNMVFYSNGTQQRVGNSTPHGKMDLQIGYH